MTKDSLIVITSLQLKKTNLIFLEHKKFSKEIPLLKLQISNLEQINKNLMLSDSIRIAQVNRCIAQLQINNNAMVDLSKSLKESEEKNKRLKSWVIGGVSVSVGLFAILLLTK